MHDMKTAASYLCGRYEETYGQKIDEMKLHKLMYFAQRESLIRTGEPLFDAEFQGWRFGPVLPALREVYKANDFAPLEEKTDSGYPRGRIYPASPYWRKKDFSASLASRPPA